MSNLGGASTVVLGRNGIRSLLAHLIMPPLSDTSFQQPEGQLP
jgi:hypothetical protein